MKTLGLILITTGIITICAASIRNTYLDMTAELRA